MRHSSKLVIISTFVAVVMLCSGSRARADFDQYWNAVGATGIMDESSRSLVTFADTGSVVISSSVPTGTAQLRYPVHPIGVMTTDLTNGNRWCLGMQYRDTGPTSRVVVSLKAVAFFIDIREPLVVTLGTLDSKVYGDTGTDYHWVLNPPAAETLARGGRQGDRRLPSARHDGQAKASANSCFSLCERRPAAADPPDPDVRRGTETICELRAVMLDVTEVHQLMLQLRHAIPAETALPVIEIERVHRIVDDAIAEGPVLEHLRLRIRIARDTVIVAPMLRP